MSKIPQISEMEWIIMKILWEDSPITANEVIDNLGDSTEWSDKTIRTFLNRLVKKEAISYKRNGREYLYFPIVSENQCIREENKTFLNRVYNGALNTMFAKFIEEEDLNEDEIEELKRMLDKKKRGVTKK